MAKNKNTDRRNGILNFYTAADNYLELKREMWREYESILVNKNSDAISNATKSQIFDGQLSTMAIERSNRVMSQLPTGKFKGMSRNDEGMSKLMNLTIDKYVIPNANSQFSFLIKLRLMDLYSNVYGNMFSFVDWIVKPNGYIGPDLWILNIRDVFPQVGALSVDDSDAIVVRTWKNKSYFEEIKDQEGFENIDELLVKIEEHSGDKAEKSAEHKSKREESYPEPIATNGKGQYSVLSMYERDRWTDYVPLLGKTIRDIDSPQEGELPIKCKHSIPLLDDFMGMGDFERGKTLQYAKNSLWNLYMDAVKISIFPPTLVNKDAVAAMSTIKFGPAEKWLMRGPNGAQGAQTLNLTPQGVQTFNNTYQVITGALLNQFGTTFTNTSSTSNVDMGKTPEALKLQAARESARDNADRFYMEQFLHDVYTQFANLISKKQPKALSIRLFPDELDDLIKQYPEMEELYNDKTGKLSVKKSTFSGCLFDYEVVSGSTYKADQDAQQGDLQSVMAALVNNMQLSQTGQVTSPMIERLRQEGKDVKISELFTRILSNSGIQDWDKIVTDGNNAESNEQYLAEHGQVFAQALQQLGVNQNAIPTQEGAGPGGQAGQLY